MKFMRKWSNQYITIPQCRVANAKERKVHTYDSRQVKQDKVPCRHLSSTEVNKGERRMYNEALVETFGTTVYRGSGNVKCCVFCKGDHYNDKCENFKLCTIQLKANLIPTCMLQAENCWVKITSCIQYLNRLLLHLASIRQIVGRVHPQMLQSFQMNFLMKLIILKVYT